MLTLSDIKSRDRVFLLDAPFCLLACSAMLLVLSSTGSGVPEVFPKTLSISGGCWVRAAPCRVLAAHIGRPRKRVQPPVPPLRRSVCQPCHVRCFRAQRSPASTHLIAAPEASLERLVPLVDYLAAWILLPNLSRWVLHTVERGYRIQFGSPPPRFNGVVPTLVDPCRLW